MSEHEIPVDQVSGVEERPQNRREWSGALRSLMLPVLIIAAIVGVLVYVDRLRGGSTPASDGYGIVELPTEKSTTGNAVSSDVGRAAPDFLLQTSAGGELRLSDLRGHPVLVNFWASWCIPCRQEMPEIVRAYAAHRDGGLQIVAVDLQENADQVRGFAGEFGMTFPIAIDRTGAVASAWRIGGPVKGIPSSYFLDADGVVRARVFGPMTSQSLADNLAAVGVQ
jgi:cytochrome c biogenesis protein CcmG/thiol:disulfide interchange protein DsbE